VVFTNLTCRKNNKVNSPEVLRFANISTCYHDPNYVLGVNRAIRTRLFLQDMYEYSTCLFAASREYKCLCRSLYKPHFLRHFFFLALSFLRLFSLTYSLRHRVLINRVDEITSHHSHGL